MNKRKFAGFNDWRLPTVEEAMSLMEPSRGEGNYGLYINPIFVMTNWPRYIWTADHWDNSRVCNVYYDRGSCHDFDFNVRDYDYFVRAVRSNY